VLKERGEYFVPSEDSNLTKTFIYQKGQPSHSNTKRGGENYYEKNKYAKRGKHMFLVA